VCLRRLRQDQVGRVAFVDQGEPVILPVNHGRGPVSWVIFSVQGRQKLPDSCLARRSFGPRGPYPERPTPLVRPDR
jgi:hypothetical protein